MRRRGEAHDGVPGVVGRGGVPLGLSLQRRGQRHGLLVALRGVPVPRVAVLLLRRGRRGAVLELVACRQTTKRPRTTYYGQGCVCRVLFYLHH